MGTILAKDLLEKVAFSLNEKSYVRWTEAELLIWLNTGQRQIVLLRPDATSVTGPISLTTGRAKQEIPAGALRLLDVTSNMGADSDTPGRSIRIVDREVLDAQIPDWRTAVGAEVVHYVYDGRAPRVFYVYPTVASTWSVEAIYSDPPVDCEINGVSGGTSDTVISLTDVYEGPLIDYVRYRAFLKDADYAGNGQQAGLAWRAFNAAIGVKVEVDTAFDPASNSPPSVNPNMSDARRAFTGR